MTWVKVCGLTNNEDVAAAVAAGADAIGFVNVPTSPRFVTLETAAELAVAVAAHTVLLTVDVAPDDALEILQRTGIDGIQPYGEYAEATAAAITATGHLALLPQQVHAGMTVVGDAGIPLLDTPSTTTLGGTGVAFDWSLVSNLDQRFVLAGGLGPNNIRRAITEVRPWGVDASSGLESVPGRKDHSMVADFISKAKET